MDNIQAYFGMKGTQDDAVVDFYGENAMTILHRISPFLQGKSSQVDLVFAYRKIQREPSGRYSEENKRKREDIAREVKRLKHI